VRGGFRPADWKLMAAAAGVITAGGLALLAHPSPEGIRAVTAISYSMVVLVAISHVRLEVIGVSIERVILWPLLIAIGVGWVIFVVENFTGIAISANRSPMLPASVHRLGGLSGGNSLILFLGLAAPLVRAPGSILTIILPAAYATLSRGLLGVGVAVVLQARTLLTTPVHLRRALLFGSWAAIVVSVLFYFFAIIPVTGAGRATGRLSLEPGGYLTPHLAAVRMFQSSPLVGVGPAGFVDRFTAFTSRAERERLPSRNLTRCDPHSAILGLGAEQGVIGLAAFGWLIYVIFVRLREIGDKALRSGAMAGLTGLLIGGHFVDWLALKGLWLWIGLLVASRKFDTR